MLRRLMHSPLHRNVLSSTAKVFGVKIVSTVLSLCTQVALARSLGVAEYGRYVFCLSALVFFVFVGRFGFEIAGLKFIPHYTATRDFSSRQSYFRFSRLFVLLASIFSILLLDFFDYFVPGGEHHQLGLILFASALFIPVDALAQIGTTELRGLRSVVRANSYDAIIRPLVLVVAYFTVIKATNTPPSATLALQAYIVGSWATLLLSTWSRDSLTSSDVITSSGKSYHVKEWLRVSAVLWILNLFEVLLSLSDVYYVGLYRGTAEAGLFAAASRLALLLIFGMVAVNSTVAPLLATAFARKDAAELKRLASIASSISILFALPVAVVFIPFGDFFLGLFGEEFRAAHWSCVILVCGQVCISAAAPAYYLVTLCHQQLRGAMAFAGALALNSLLNLYLTPSMGIEGAAISSAISAIALHSCLYWIARSRVNITWGPWMLKAVFSRKKLFASDKSSEKNSDPPLDW